MSMNEAKRLIQQGAVRINGVVDKDWKKNIEIKDGDTVQIGKRRFFRIKIKKKNV